MRPRLMTACGLVTLAASVMSAGTLARQKDAGPSGTAAANVRSSIWHNSGDVSSLNLTYGTGGRAHAPHAAGTFTFVKEDALATSPKFDVIDGQGTTWKVKLGEESQAETSATRFLWAAGYYTDEDYYLARLTVRGLPTLERGQEFVSAGGVVHGARLERKVGVVKEPGNWDWFDNPFTGQRELNGLRVMMSLLNNWDLKRVNNSIYTVDGERHYVVSDAGAAFGNTGNSLTRSKGSPEDYQHSKFVDRVTPGFVDFVLHSRPFFLGALEVGNYLERTKMEDVTKHIPVADVRWLARRLSRLTEGQIRDAFRAGGYGTKDVDTLTKTMRRRIAALKAL